MIDTIETIRLSEKQKQQLIRLKSKTGIENWNVLCRWALCMSLSEATPPPYEDIPSDSNVEMSWKVFSGEFSDVYKAVLIASFRTREKNDSTIGINEYLKLHINRGISIFQKSLI